MTMTKFTVTRLLEFPDQDGNPERLLFSAYIEDDEAPMVSAKEREKKYIEYFIQGDEYYNLPENKQARREEISRIIRNVVALKHAEWMGTEVMFRPPEPVVHDVREVMGGM